MRIGVDVGGTNTDAVVMLGREVRAAFKSPTTADVGSGIRNALTEVLRQAEAKGAQIGAVMIGTTHFTNAFVQARALARVGVIRLAAPATTSLPPFADWPDRLRDVVAGPAHVVRGGYNYDGSQIAEPVRAEILAAAEAIRDAGVRAVAISSVFAPVNAAQEQFARDIVSKVIPEAAITLSHELGRIGLIERENAAIMNASLSAMAGDVVRSFSDALAALDIRCPLYVSQNDGTLMPPQVAARYPVLTFASGPTNSIRGGGFLTGLTDCIVADIGGTTTDVGVLSGGLPRESSIAVDVGGVRTNFRMPDVLSIGLGGGSRVRQAAGSVTVGHDSVGFKLRSEGLVFGGSTLTATDIAVAAGMAKVGDADAVKHLERGLVAQSLRCIAAMIEDAIDRMKTSSSAVPVVLVGGGSILAPTTLRGAAQVIIPKQAGVANAIGAAIAQVSGEVDQVYSYEQLSREVALERARADATNEAVAAGADSATVQIADVEELPLQYLPGGAVRVRVKAVGELAGLGV
ncbi:hydantoinase/oxoprolinase family protein [Steroidobacter sp.]|uniref:hydantoinase/oxoprolinase family protein n=1 Tax=Steroidobacter sp. TaxID=1978227 RepID=UPI0032C241B3